MQFPYSVFVCRPPLVLIIIITTTFLKRHWTNCFLYKTVTAEADGEDSQWWLAEKLLDLIQTQRIETPWWRIMGLIFMINHSRCHKTPVECSQRGFFCSFYPVLKVQYFCVDVSGSLLYDAESGDETLQHHRCSSSSSSSLMSSVDLVLVRWGCWLGVSAESQLLTCSVLSPVKGKDVNVSRGLRRRRRRKRRESADKTVLTLSDVAPTSMY